MAKMIKLGRALLLLALLSPFLLGGWPARAVQANRAGLIVVYGTGNTFSTCVSFSEAGLSGAELLRRAGLTVISQSTWQGEAICKINTVGCNVPTQCFCQCPGNPCVYWGYWVLQGGNWVYSGMGASSRIVHNGDVDAWVWGNDSTTPPALGLDVLCAAAQAATITPTVTRTPLPTFTATAAPATATLSPTPTPTGVPPTATHTGVPATPTPTSVSLYAPPTQTAIAQATQTALAGPTSTPWSAYDSMTSTPVPSSTPGPTDTPLPTATLTETPSPTPEADAATPSLTPPTTMTRPALPALPTLATPGLSATRTLTRTVTGAALPAVSATRATPSATRERPPAPNAVTTPSLAPPAALTGTPTRDVVAARIGTAVWQRRATPTSTSAANDIPAQPRRYGAFVALAAVLGAIIAYAVALRRQRERLP
jgi:hypothetical protein